MRAMRLALGLLLLALVAPAAAQADTPTARTLYEDGPEGRFLIDGDWLFRLDASDPWRPSRSRTPGTSATTRSPRSPARSAGTARTSSCRRKRGARVGGALRVGQLPLAGLAQRARDRPHAGAYLPFTVLLDGLKRRGVNRLVIRVDSRRLATDLPPGRMSSAHRPADRRLVELRRHPARGLPPAARHAADRVRAHHPAPARRHRERRLPGPRAERQREQPPGHAHRRLRRAPHTARRAHRAARRDGELPRLARRSEPASVVAERPVPLPRGRRGAGGRPARRPLERPRRRALGQRRRRPPDPQRAAGAAPRRRPARGHRRPGLRGRQRLPPLAGRPREGARRDDAAHALPDAPLHPRGRRPRGAADLVRDPRLLAQELADRRHHAARAGRAAPQHRDQRQPSLGADLVDRQRALLQAGADPGDLHPPRRADRPRARSHAPGRPRRRRLPGRGCQRRYRPLDVIGINDYFGWYPGPQGSLFDRDRLSAYLD